MKPVYVPVEEIYVPMKFKGLLDTEKAQALSDDILENGQQTPIQVRKDPKKDRYVLVSGLHRLEAFKIIGEPTINALVVQARKF